MSESTDRLFPHPGDEQLSLVKGVPEQARPGAALDAAQTFDGASSHEVRDELEELVRRDLLGPWGGESEEFAPKAMGPRERYLANIEAGLLVLGGIAPERAAEHVDALAAGGVLARM